MRRPAGSLPANLPGLFALLSALAIALPGAGAPARNQERPVVRKTVNLVTVVVNVQDAEGRPLTGLPQEAFTVLDEGRPQKLAVFEPGTQQPLDLALMLDTSLSTIRELEFEKEAAIRFIHRVVRSEDSLAVYAFAEGVDRYTPYTSNLGTLENGVKRITPGAGTSLYDAIYLASNEIRRRPAGHRRAIVLVTDAGETTSATSFEDTRRAALVSEALLYTIIVRAERSEALRNLAGEHALVTITDATGGAMFMADEMRQVDPLYAEIDRELRTQYLLAFYPQPEPPPRSIRHLEVRVAGPQAGATAPLRLRHRREYLTGGATE